MNVSPPNTKYRKELTIQKKIVFSIFVTSAFGLFLYAASFGVRSIRLYNLIKNNERGWRGKTLAADPVLGYAPIPGSTGAELTPMGRDIPARFDNRGFRVPVEPEKVGPDGSPSVLVLGCSYTYGYCCSAEESYPYILSKLTGCSSMNAGVSSYGLAQMLLLARRLIPQQRPDFVVVQYSPWLAQRAQNFYAHGDTLITTPVPFFWEPSSGELRLHPPVFRSRAVGLGVDAYRNTPGSLGDYLSFFLKIGGPLLVYDDYHMGAHRFKRLAGITPRPAPDQQTIITNVYNEISELCSYYNSKMVILVLGGNAKPVDHTGLERIPGAKLVDAHKALLAQLPERTDEAFGRLYGHWKRNPPLFVDEHPNPTAHAVIARELANAIDQVRRADPLTSIVK
jgi:hypothetical protein